MPTKEYPTTISLSEKDLPAIKKWKVDGVYTVELTIKQTASRRSMYSKDKMLTADFEIKKVKDVTAKDPLDMDHKEYGLEKVKALSA